MGKSGGGSPGPQQNTTVTSNIPEYAQPYVTNMLEATQRQIFKGNKTPEGGFDITGFEGYTPYSTNVNDYYAGFSPLQKQSQMDAGAMQQPGQFALGSGLAGSAGIRSLGAAGQFGQDVTNKQRVDAAGNPMFDANRNPIFDASNTTQSFMSPYQQAVTNAAKSSAVRESQMAQQAQNLGAARTGTYGGARQLLANTERERNLLTNLTNIETQGAQSAYDRAMQTQQYGAGLGMTGYNQALNAGSQLAQIGATQQGTDIARQNQMAAMGQQQQGLEQSKINQAIQDYATQQQYPQMQLGLMSNMLRGLPMQSQTTQGYQAQPSMLSQVGGLGLTAAGIYGMSGGFKGAKEGGLMGAKGYKEGGLTYAGGGDISMMSDEELTEMLKNPSLDPMLRAEIEKLLMLHQRMKMNPQTEQIMAPALERSGVASIGTGDMVPEQMPAGAGGGIVAFSNRGVVNLKDPKLSDSTAERRKLLQDRESALFKRLFEDQDPFKESKASEEELRKSLTESSRMNPYAAMATTGLAMLKGSSDPSKRGNILSEIGEAGEAGLGTYAKGKASESDMKRALLGQVEKREASKFGRDVALQNALTTSLGQMDAKELGMLNARSNQALAASTKDSNLRLKYATLFKDTVDDVKESMLKQDKFGQLYRKDPAGFNRAAEMEAKRLMPKEALEILGKTVATAEAPAADPVVPGGKKPAAPPPPVSYPMPTADAISALKSRKDKDVAVQQFDKIFGPGAASKILSK
jgi:hypothetical protein